MLFCKIVLNLPVDGPFDYSIGDEFALNARLGQRVQVNFRNKKEVGIIVGISKTTTIDNVKPIINLIDLIPVIDKNFFELAKWISEYYCCTLGEAIFLILPQALRRGKKIQLNKSLIEKKELNATKNYLVYDENSTSRWKFYFEQIKKTVTNNQSVIVLFSDKDKLEKFSKLLKSSEIKNFKFLLRSQKDELAEWVEIKNNSVKIVIGTRSNVFSPLLNLGLIIVDEECEYGFKQDQSPHYHAREVAFKRAKIQNSNLIFCSRTPSLEALKISKDSDFEIVRFPNKTNELAIKIVDMKNLPETDKKSRVILSDYLQDSILKSLVSKEKILLFYNKKGFATVNICSNCSKSLKCPRCNVNLVFHNKTNSLVCHFCNYTQPIPQKCPFCSIGNINFLGAGTEKVESEIKKVFPQARIQILEKSQNIDNADIVISTETVLRYVIDKFDLVAVLGIDSLLNYVDFRACERTFQLLVGLISLSRNKVIIQSSLTNHYVMNAIVNSNSDLFYDEELNQRKELDFPPFYKFIMIKLRCKVEDKVQKESLRLFEILSKNNLLTDSILSYNVGYPAKLRGNFYWNIMLKTKDVAKINSIIKPEIRNFNRSGIIVTVDVDPI